MHKPLLIPLAEDEPFSYLPLLDSPMNLGQVFPGHLGKLPEFHNVAYVHSVALIESFRPLFGSFFPYL